MVTECLTDGEWYTSRYYKNTFVMLRSWEN